MLLHTVAPLSKRLPFSKGGARSARAVREAARSKPSKARSVASEPCERSEATMPHCGMLSAKLTEGCPIPPSRLAPCHLPFPFGKKEAFGQCNFIRLYH